MYMYDCGLYNVVCLVTLACYHLCDREAVSEVVEGVVAIVGLYLQLHNKMNH